MSELIDAVTVEEMAETLRRCGYRANVVEFQGRPQVRSAAQGLGFIVAFGGSPKPDSSGVTRYADLAFQCWIAIEGDLAHGIIDRWNQQQRFARLFRQGQMLVLCYDVLVAGGVAPEHLLSQCELWDRIIHELIRHLKQPPPALAAGRPGPATAG